MARATMDIAQYLVDVIGLERVATRIKTPLDLRATRSVTYHDPCHLARGQGVRDHPRQLLRLACGPGFKDMAEADRCCGLAGTYA